MIVYQFLYHRADSDGGTTSADELPETEYMVLYISDSKLTSRSFYNYLLNQLGCKSEYLRNSARQALHRQIEIMRSVQNRKAVVIIDEAHLLQKEMLEEARFLLNFNMDSENLLALILSGQTELWEKLKLSAYRVCRRAGQTRRHRWLLPAQGRTPEKMDAPGRRIQRRD